MASFIKQQDEAKERFKKWEDERWQRNMEIEEIEEVIDTQRNCRLVHKALVKTFRTCTAKILVNALTK